MTRIRSSQLENLAKRLVPMIEDVTHAPLSIDELSFEFADFNDGYEYKSWIDKVYNSLMTAWYDSRTKYNKKIGVALRLIDASDQRLLSILAHELTHASDEQNNNSAALIAQRFYHIVRLKQELCQSIELCLPHSTRYTRNILSHYTEEFHVLRTIEESHAMHVRNIIQERLNLPITTKPLREQFRTVAYRLLCLHPAYARVAKYYTDGRDLIDRAYQEERSVQSLFIHLPSKEHFKNPECYFTSKERRPSIPQDIGQESQFGWDMR